VFNEIVIMLINYHMVCFSEFNLSLEMQFYMGNSMIGWIVAMITVNLACMVYQIS
jgi:hypothetical protein